MHQLIQLVGALLVLGGFVLAQRHVVDARSRAYLLLNLAGSSVLAVDAWQGAQWGFFLLEVVWAVVSAAGLAGTVRPQTSSSSTRTENGSRQSSSASPSIVSRHS